MTLLPTSSPHLHPSSFFCDRPGLACVGSGNCYCSGNSPFTISICQTNSQVSRLLRTSISLFSGSSGSPSSPFYVVGLGVQVFPWLRILWRPCYVLKSTQIGNSDGPPFKLQLLPLPFDLTPRRSWRPLVLLVFCSSSKVPVSAFEGSSLRVHRLLSIYILLTSDLTSHIGSRSRSRVVAGLSLSSAEFGQVAASTKTSTLRICYFAPLRWPT
ncbi:hypothetical protein DFH06DRAFT_290899 [Mycena polygramma]|nr:hypothetical protein DFH06DRAFT_290899 [Mycena polygramma]